MSRKRHRGPTASESDAQEAAQVICHFKDEELWLDDGNIILVAGNVEFMVYRGPLIAHSTVFGHMFSLPQPNPANRSSGQESAETPTIHLQDSPEDLRHVLRFLIPGKTLRKVHSDEPSFAQISAYIRLGHKYAIDNLVEDSVAYLKRFYSDKMESWFEAEGLGPPEFGDLHHIGVVNLARLVGENSILPTAIWICSQLGGKLIDGFEREDGTPERLSSQDLATCFVLADTMPELRAGSARRVFKATVAKDCRAKELCRVSLLELFAGIPEDELTSSSWCYSWEDHLNDWSKDLTKSHICSRCQALVKDRDAEERQKM